MKSIQELRDAHKGETCRIVGKGPSLRDLGESDIGSGPVIAIAEATVVAERLGYVPRRMYSLQKDIGNYEPRSGCPVLLSFHESRADLPGYEPSYVFDMVSDLHLPYNGWSAVAACEIARLMGCTALDYICCDVMTTGDMSTYDPLKGTIEMVPGNYSPLPMALLHHLAFVGIKTTFTHPAAALRVVSRAEAQAEMNKTLTNKIRETPLMKAKAAMDELTPEQRRKWIEGSWGSPPDCKEKFMDLCPPPRMGTALP
jgi:hypothetical protein